MTTFDILLTIHIAAGFTALVAGFIATVAKSLDTAHQVHVRSGRVFVWGMLVIFITAIPMTVIRPNVFIALIAVLSVYLAVAGWRYATNRAGTPRSVDWATAAVMALTSVVMIVYGGVMLRAGSSNGITMVVLGGVGAGLAALDLRTLRRGGARGTDRIAQHVTMMLAGSIATVTAFLVTNIQFQPAFVVWLAPTAVVTPLIVFWTRRLRMGRRVRGMPAA